MIRDNAFMAYIFTEAALWTDGRYFIQAENQLDCNWILMKQGEPGVILSNSFLRSISIKFIYLYQVPSLTDWLRNVLNTTDIVAADPTLIGTSTWISYKDQLGTFKTV